jgi:hypothetical protein
MSDRDNQRSADFLLDRLYEGHQDLERQFESFLDVGETFLAEVRRGADLRRLQRLRQAIEKPRAGTASCFDSQSRRVEALDKILRDWRPAGREYAHLVDQAYRLREGFVHDLTEIRDAGLRIITAIEAFDDFLAAAH